MHIITLAANPDEGAFAIEDEFGDKVLMIFEEYDDAERYLYMLGEMDYPEMEVTEVDKEALLIACEHFNYEYAIITKNDLVVPPKYAQV